MRTGSRNPPAATSYSNPWTRNAPSRISTPREPPLATHASRAGIIQATRGPKSGRKKGWIAAARAVGSRIVSMLPTRKLRKHDRQSFLIR